MALKSLGTLAPGVSRVEPVSKSPRPCTGAKSTVTMNMVIVTDFTLGLAVSKAEADLYLHWADDLLAPAKDDVDDSNG
ncbi:hypothetical protein [Devosia sp. 2618]|uniref:hypothetical protein n=1 Tax=Devosia sp. 2618 TaxID=3156454 RepID=UPI003392B130